MHDQSATWNKNWVKGKLRFAKFKDALISVCHTPFSRTEASFVRLRPQNPRIHGPAVPTDFPLITGQYFDWAHGHHRRSKLLGPHTWMVRVAFHHLLRFGSGVPHSTLSLTNALQVLIVHVVHWIRGHGGSWTRSGQCHHPVGTWFSITRRRYLSGNFSFVVMDMNMKCEFQWITIQWRILRLPRAKGVHVLWEFRPTTEPDQASPSRGSPSHRAIIPSGRSSLLTKPDWRVMYRKHID